MSRNDRWLLPEGIEEVLPAEARRVERLRRRVLDLFDRWGYDLVMPPMLEYLESLLTGTAKELDLQTFKVTDQLTGRLMGIRADITPQAARIDAHYLKRTTPVRLCYIGPVVRTLPGEFAGSREPLQLGAELYGHRGPESDVEVLQLMLAALRETGVPQCYLDLGHVGVFRGLARAAGLSTEQEADLFDALQRKAGPEVETFVAGLACDNNVKRMLGALVNLHGDGDVLDDARTQFRGAPTDVIAALDNLQVVAARLRAALPDQPLHFDLAELHGYRYYTGVVFSAFVPGYGMAVAQGGRYDDIGKAFGRARPAAGFSADLRRLVNLVNEAPARRGGIAAPNNDDAALRTEIARLRAHGERVVVQLNGRDTDCDRELIQRDGKWTVAQI